MATPISSDCNADATFFVRLYAKKYRSNDDSNKNVNEDGCAEAIGRMRRAFLGVLMGLLCAASCVASARTSLFPAVGARSNGMGSMSTTLRGDGAALFGNPSLMADVSKSTLSVDTTQSALAATVPFGKYGSVGVGMADLADHDRFLFNQSWNPIGTFETDRNRLSVGYAARLHSQLSIGATYDGWRSYNDTWSTGWSAGLLVRPTDVLHIGVEAHQVGDELRPRFGALLRPNRKMQFRMELERRDLAFGAESS
ncbi:MAG: hypothetical protein O3A46_13880, partial [Candidatus Poribacteria bacterium]|nr:hypothetical protein [Candidatus Poribacteria bacterium]